MNVDLIKVKIISVVCTTNVKTKFQNKLCTKVTTLSNQCSYLLKFKHYNSFFPVIVDGRNLGYCRGFVKKLMPYMWEIVQIQFNKFPPLFPYAPGGRDGACH